MSDSDDPPPEDEGAEGEDAEPSPLRDADSKIFAFDDDGVQSCLTPHIHTLACSPPPLWPVGSSGIWLSGHTERLGAVSGSLRAARHVARGAEQPAAIGGLHCDRQLGL